MQIIRGGRSGSRGGGPGMGRGMAGERVERREDEWKGDE